MAGHHYILLTVLIRTIHLIYWFNPNIELIAGRPLSLPYTPSWITMHYRRLPWWRPPATIALPYTAANCFVTTGIGEITVTFLCSGSGGMLIGFYVIEIQDGPYRDSPRHTVKYIV